MEDIKKYDNYPAGIVILSNAVTLSIYGLGLFIISRARLAYAFIYLLYILALECNLFRNHCPNCYYWGKLCGFGRGKISSLFFKKGDNNKFCIRQMTWKEMIPDILVSLIPFIIGIFLLIQEFSFILLSAVVFLFLLTTTGNGYIRSKLTCTYCKQRELGCPADQLFSKKAS